MPIPGDLTAEGSWVKQTASVIKKMHASDFLKSWSNNLGVVSVDYTVLTIRLLFVIQRQVSTLMLKVKSSCFGSPSFVNMKKRQSSKQMQLTELTNDSKSSYRLKNPS